MQNGILKRAILDFRWFYALKAMPNRPVESVGLGAQGVSRRSVGLATPGSLKAVCGVGRSRESHGGLWGWALQGVSRQSVGLGTPGSLTAVCGIGQSSESHGGWALQEVVSVGEE